MSAPGGRLPPGPALHAPALLARFDAAGVIAAADVQVARRLGRLTGEDDERVLLAVALAVRAVRSGSVCVDLDDREPLAAAEGEGTVPAADLPWPEDDGWEAALRDSPLVASGPDDGEHDEGQRDDGEHDGERGQRGEQDGGHDDRPVRRVGRRLYLDRYWRDERLVRSEVDGRLRAEPFGVDAGRLRSVLDDLLPPGANPRQRLAAAAVALGRVTVLTGGPGTGKTTTVARVLAVLDTVAGPGLRVALAAPTGKAAARLEEAVRAEARSASPGSPQSLPSLPSASTIHRLLGWRPGSSTRFRHDRDHHLPHDVVVVDETSMVSLPLMARLLEALRPDARLLLVGDPDQLASVEAGAVLGDLVARPAVGGTLPAALDEVLPGEVPAEPDERAVLGNGVVRLTRGYRFGGAIDRLATAVRAGDPDAVLATLRSGDPSVSLVETVAEWPSPDETADLHADAVAAGSALVAAARGGDARAALAALGSHRLLLAHRRGPAGAAHWARVVEEWVTEAVGPAPVGAGRGERSGPPGEWYPGRPLLVTRNDRATGLYNGDTGVVVARPGGGDRDVVAVFGDADQPSDPVRPHRLPEVETVHAMTVHRSQGSQFGRVTLLLPPATSPLLTRELLYTAVTRAGDAVRVIGSAEAVAAAVTRPVRRASGLRDPL